MATKKSFKVGDIVKLKSGGPDMTIQTAQDDGDDDAESVQCQWFAGKKLEHGWFPPSSLDAVTP